MVVIGTLSLGLIAIMVLMLVLMLMRSRTLVDTESTVKAKKECCWSWEG